ncbi:hypothetical protein Rhe02_33290 [Rhizocola hellebori]|uniref:Uncharacterized protein n=1 Tax=Rhizocola hellebori TaxID=1392758 RepID=A0A8J3VGL5_9ACTN|nr:hypothetical protein [Rhizocola hellebori]GIH05262.1 hypothetical protein Rhe02_33290 [Rhizocola hellebori]
MPQRGTAGEAAQTAPRQQLDFLHRVVGVIQRAEHAVAVHMQRPPVRGQQRGERFMVASQGRGEQGCFAVDRCVRAHNDTG